MHYCLPVVYWLVSFLVKYKTQDDINIYIDQPFTFSFWSDTDAEKRSQDVFATYYLCADMLINQKYDNLRQGMFHAQS